MQNGQGNKRRDDGSNNSNDNATMEAPTPTYRVYVSRRFVVLSLLSCTLLAYAVGRTARVLLLAFTQRTLAELQQQQQQQQQQSMTIMAGQQQRQQSALLPDGNTKPDRVMKLPNPVLKNKPVPETIYTSMNFDTARSSSINSRWVVVEETPRDKQRGTCENDGVVGTCKNPDAESAETIETVTSTSDEDEELHLPAGQHLLMDIRRVQPAFLASEERLAEAMLDVVNDCGLTLLSYHCHGLQPAGVSCVGVLLESHVSFHTWPSKGVITLDLFTCGSQSLLPIVNKTEQVFGIPDSSGEPPEVRWAYKVRGFGDKTDAELADLFTFPIGAMTEYKEELLSTRTKWHRVDIYDVLRPQFQSYRLYQRSLRENNQTYESNNPELFAPDRILFVDGVLQTRRSAEIQYHEALVHPAMFAHSGPVNVLLLNVGSGAALREVLKHKSVERVTVVEEHPDLFEIIQEYFPEFNDCSFIVNASTGKCYDDSRVQVIFADLYDWVLEEYNDDGTGEGRNTSASIVEDPYDVVIMDDLYYIDGPAEYGDFMRHLSELLSPFAVFAASTGQAPRLRTPSPENSVMKSRFDFFHSLPDYGFKSVIDYEESHVGFSWPWQFVVAFRDYDSRVEWFANGAWLDLKIASLTYPTIDGNPELLHFDGAVMQSYAYPSRASEVVFCRGNPDSTHCKDGHGFDPERPHIPSSQLEVKMSSEGENVGRGLFAKVDIPEYSYVALDQAVHPVHIEPDTTAVALAMRDKLEHGEDYPGQIVMTYGANYGHAMSHHGSEEFFVDSNILCFLNHGCDGKHNFSYNISVTELTADRSVPDEIALHQRRYGDEYNPAAERHPESRIRSTPLRDIKAGEELFINYLAVAGVMWYPFVEQMKGECAGKVGPIREYEMEKSEQKSL